MAGLDSRRQESHSPADWIHTTQVITRIAPVQTIGKPSHINEGVTLANLRPLVTHTAGSF